MKPLSMKCCYRCVAQVITLMVLFWISKALFAQNMVTEVLSAGFRSTDELVAILRPLIPPPGSIGGFQNQLVIKTTADNLDEIKRLLLTLNKPPANLLISVRRQLDAEINHDLREAQITMNTANAGARVGSASSQQSAKGIIRHGHVSVTGGASQRTIRSQGRGTQQLRVLEGKKAFIRTGESVPTGERTVIVNGAGVSVNDSVRYQEFGTGFSVQARLNGDHVTLDIYPSRRERRGDSSAAVQLASTSISGVLGQWMQIGGVNSSSVRDSSRLGSSRHITTNKQDDMYVKVERLN